MFFEVDSKDLVVGAKYAALKRFDDFNYFTCTFKGHQTNVGRTFHYIKSHCRTENIETYRTLRNMQNKKKDISFYVFVPKKAKIQQSMEQRALDKILKRFINDDFTW
jgi:hypothetical protein